MDFVTEVDKPDYLVHGTYLENLSRIVRAGGLFPSLMLPEDLKPLRYFERKPATQFPENVRERNYISTIVLHTNIYGYNYSFQKEYMWNRKELFHFYIVSNYPFRSISKDTKELGANDRQGHLRPYHSEGVEVALYNQGLALDTFVAFVVPTNERIRDCSYQSKRIFQSGSGDHRRHTMTCEEIAERVMKKIKAGSLTIPIFNTNGQLIS